MNTETQGPRERLDRLRAENERIKNAASNLGHEQMTEQKKEYGNGK